MEQPKSTIKCRMSDIHVGGLPLWLYLLALVLLAAALWMDCLPRNIVGAFFLLMILGDGLNYLGNTIPVVKTYLGGSVICIFGGAILAAAGVFPQSAMDTMDAFVNDEGFLVLYISALITGSLFSIDRNLLLQGAVRILPVSLTALLVGFLVCGGIGVVSGNGFWNNILYVAVPMTSGGMTAGTVPLSQVYAAQLGLSKVITKSNRQNYNRIAQAVGLDSIISPKQLATSHILQVVRGMQNSQGSVMNALYRIADGAAEAMEFTVTASTRHLGTPLRDLSLKPGILVAVVARGGEIIIPEGSTSIQEGDSVILISRDRRLQDLNDIYDEGEHTFSAPGGMS
mgnify:CR=1 FL=1